MINFKDLKVLVISTHTDDADLGMGATINRMIREGAEVVHVALSDADKQNQLRGFKPNQLSDEFFKANFKYTCDEIDSGVEAHISSFPTDYFHDHRQAVANALFRWKEYVKPDMVFVNSTYDTHQDHQVTINEAIRIFKDNTLLGYEFPYNNLKFSYDLLIEVQREDVSAKLGALSMYKSQRDRIYFDRRMVEGLLRVNGIRSKVEFAEAFEIIRMKW